MWIMFRHSRSCLPLTLLSATFLFAAGCSHLHAQKFLYVGDCTRLNKYDLATGARLPSIDLAGKFPQNFAPFPRAKAGCPLVDAAPVSSGNEALLLSQFAPPYTDRMMLTRVSLPTFSQSASAEIHPSADSASLEASPDGTLFLRTESNEFFAVNFEANPMHLTPRQPKAVDLGAGAPITPASAAPQLPAMLALSTFAPVPPALQKLAIPGTSQLPVTLLERSGSTLLAASATSDAAPLFLVDLKAHRLMSLPVHSAPGLAHLAPGGALVLAEEASKGAKSTAHGSGQLTLIDAHSGAVVKHAQVAVGAHFLRILPSGDAVFLGARQVFLVRCGAGFLDVPVISDSDATPTSKQIHFFANR